jgi:hypothetical protein
MAARMLFWLGLLIAVVGCSDRPAQQATASCSTVRPPAPYSVGSARAQDLFMHPDLMTRC